MPSNPSSELLARYRIRMGQAAGILFLLLAKPRLRWLFALGLLISLLGEGLRLWAAGTIQKNRQLARSGPYALVRHPLYLGSFLVVVGFCLGALNPYHPLRTFLLWLLALGGFALVYRRKIVDEEATLAQLFSEDFQCYRQTVPAFWPRLHTLLDAKMGEFDFKLALRNRELRTLWGLLAAACLLWMKLIYRF